MTIADKAVGVTDWTIDSSHSTFEFTVRHILVSTIKGAFLKVNGQIHFEPENVTASTVKAEVDMTSVDTHNPGRDDMLKGAAQFNVEEFPTSTFLSKRVEPMGVNRFLVIGDLTFRGVTNEVTFDTTFEGSAEQSNGIVRSAFIGRGWMKRTEFGLPLGNIIPAGVPSVLDEIQLTMYLTCQPTVVES